MTVEEIKNEVIDKSTNLVMNVQELTRNYLSTADKCLNEIESNISSITPELMIKFEKCIYDLVSAVGEVGVLKSKSHAVYKEAYNNFYMNPELDKPKPTVAELTAYAESKTIEHTEVYEMYSKAYEILKNKLDVLYSINDMLLKVYNTGVKNRLLNE